MTALTWLKALIAAVLGAVLVTGCASAPPPPATPEPPATEQTAPEQPAQEPVQPSSRAWMDAELTDVSTGRTFKISDFKGRPVLLHAFAVW